MCVCACARARDRVIYMAMIASEVLCTRSEDSFVGVSAWGIDSFLIYAKVTSQVEGTK